MAVAVGTLRSSVVIAKTGRGSQRESALLLSRDLFRNGGISPANRVLSQRKQQQWRPAALNPWSVVSAELLNYLGPLVTTMSYSMRVNEATLAALRLALLWLLWAIYMEAKVVVTEGELFGTGVALLGNLSETRGYRAGRISVYVEGLSAPLVQSQRRVGPK